MWTPWRWWDPTAAAGGFQPEGRACGALSIYGETYIQNGSETAPRWFHGSLFATKVTYRTLALFYSIWIFPWKPRVVLLILVLLACHCLWLLEQPRQSLLATHRRFQWLINHVAYAPYFKTMYRSIDFAWWLIYAVLMSKRSGIFSVLLDAASWSSKSEANHMLVKYAWSEYPWLGETFEGRKRKTNHPSNYQTLTYIFSLQTAELI